jgi:hypothetical protein
MMMMIMIIIIIITIIVKISSWTIIPIMIEIIITTMIIHKCTYVDYYAHIHVNLSRHKYTYL